MANSNRLQTVWVGDSRQMPWFQIKRPETKRLLAQSQGYYTPGSSRACFSTALKQSRGCELPQSTQAKQGSFENMTRTCVHAYRHTLTCTHTSGAHIPHVTTSAVGRDLWRSLSPTSLLKQLHHTLVLNCFPSCEGWTSTDTSNNS